MTKQITVHSPLPKNLPKQYLELYKKNALYTVDETEVKCYRNVFVSHEGLCLKNLRFLPRSSFNIRTKYDNSFGWGYYRLVAEQYLVSTFGRSLKKLELDDKAYTLIHTKWFNYSFWLTSSLIRLYKAQLLQNETTIIYPEEWRNIAYVNESLALFPSVKQEPIDAGVHLQVKQLVLPEVREFTSAFNPADILAFKEYVYSHISRMSFDLNLSGKTYITRRKAKYRKIQNENDVLGIVRTAGYDIVDFEDYSFLEQVYIMSKTRSLISIHGAGLSNIMFMPSGGNVLELMHHYEQKLDYRFTFWKLAQCSELNYYIQFCNMIKENQNPLFNDLIVDPKLLQNNILLMSS